MCRKSAFLLIAAMLGSQAMAAIEVNTVGFPAIENVTSWPQPFTDTTTAIPSTFAQVENQYGGVAPYSLAQSWTATTSGNLIRIQLLISGTPPVTFKINLYDAYVWDKKKNSASQWFDIGNKQYKAGENVSKSLLPSTAPLTWTGYTSQDDKVGVLQIVLTGADAVSIDKDHQYIFEITSDADISNLMWYRNASTETNFLTGQGFRQTIPLNGMFDRDFAAAFTIGMPSPEPVKPAAQPAVQPAAQPPADANAKDVNKPAAK